MKHSILRWIVWRRIAKERTEQNEDKHSHYHSVQSALRFQHLGWRWTLLSILHTIFNYARQRLILSKPGLFRCSNVQRDTSSAKIVRRDQNCAHAQSAGANRKRDTNTPIIMRIHQGQSCWLKHSKSSFRVPPCKWANLMRRSKNQKMIKTDYIDMYSF